MTSGWKPFAEFVTDRDVPVDFVSRHAYTSRTGPAPASSAPGRLWPRPRTCAGAARRASPASGRHRWPAWCTSPNSTSYRPDNPIHDTAFPPRPPRPGAGRRQGDLVDLPTGPSATCSRRRGADPLAWQLLACSPLPADRTHTTTPNTMARLGDEVPRTTPDHPVTRRHPTAGSRC
ncbi:hypothetical protein V2I01_31950 [Micromonospora sp. BRA006-A]|nr:hypothetical protein [Micromonospora sp. BRA006-A]